MDPFIHKYHQAAQDTRHVRESHQQKAKNIPFQGYSPPVDKKMGQDLDCLPNEQQRLDPHEAATR